MLFQIARGDNDATIVDLRGMRITNLTQLNLTNTDVPKAPLTSGTYLYVRIL
jgi:hypothetical protein